MKDLTTRKPPGEREANATTTTTDQPPTITEAADDVEQMLATIRRFESAARTIADDDALTVKARCKAMLALIARARARDGAAFLERAVWKGCAHFFDDDDEVPKTIIEANHRLIRQGHDRCPECLRPLPSIDDLHRWRRLGHEMHTTRRSAGC